MMAAVTSDGVRHWAEVPPTIGLFHQSSGGVPLVLILPVLGALSQLAKYRRQLLRFRWFAMTFLLFGAASAIPTTSISPRDAGFPCHAYLCLVGVLFLEHVLVILGGVWKRLTKSKQ